MVDPEHALAVSRRIFVAGALVGPWVGAADASTAISRLEWRGTARVHAGERIIDLGLHTVVKPFAEARSESWLRSDGPEKTNVLIIAPDRGIVERQGRQLEMPATETRHERQQYGLYGYMLKALQRRRQPSTLRLSQQGYPPVVLYFDQGLLASADYTVDAPEGDRKISQHITFDGDLESGGVRWPQRLSIRQDGKPYFDLALYEFSVQ